MNASFKIKDISFTNMGNLWFEHSVVGESYGRRFIAHLGAEGSETHQQSEKVIFNDLFKKARKLAKEASNDKERAQVKELIGKLIGIEASAKKAYNDRSDCIYKFRSFFHRLFGGAFSGSHIKRLEKLQKKVECSVGKGDFRPAQENVQKNFQVFLSYLQLKGSLKIGDYTFSRSEALDGFVIHKKGSSRNIVCYYDQDHVFKMEYEGKAEAPIPKILNKVCHRAMQKIYKETTKINACTWTNRSKIMLLEAGLKEAPLFHLDAFCKRPQEFFTIKFLNDDLTASDGFDSGGLSRAYISGLAQGVCFSKSLFAGALGVPKPSPKAIDKGIIPRCTSEERHHYCNLGKLLRYCLESGDKKSGQCLNDGVYGAIYLLTNAQIQGNVTDLDRATCIAMAQSIIPHIDKKVTSTGTQVMNSLALLVKEELAEADFKDAMSRLQLTGCQDFLDDDFEIDWQKIQANPQEFKDRLFRSIFSDPNLIDELGGTSLGAMISGIHSVAKGLSDSEQEWKEKYGIESWQDLKTKIQGVLDRQIICDSINLFDNDDAAEPHGVKFTWLKNWIQEGATEEEIAAFLRYVTGAPCILSGRSIKITFEDTMQALSIAHTCGMSLALSDKFGPDALDGTEEGFIEGLKYSIQMFGFNAM